MTTSKPTEIRKFWIRLPDGHFEYGTVNENHANFLDSIEVIENASYEQLKAEKYIQTSGMETEITVKDKVIIQQGDDLKKLREQVKDYEVALDSIRQPFNNKTNYIDRAVRAQEKAWDVLKKWGGG